MNRIIFLDIDGVLNNPKSLMDGNKPDIDCIKALNWLVAETGAKIVVSSTWRGRPDLLDVFKSWGCNFEVIGITPSLESKTVNGVFIGKERGNEIAKWLEKNRGKWEFFVILDDDDDMGHLKPNLVQTNYKYGLTWADARKAKSLLMGDGNYFSFPSTPRTYA